MTIHIAGTGAEYHPTEVRSDGGPVILQIRGQVRDTLCGIILTANDADRGRTILPHDHPEACAECLRLAKGPGGFAYKVPVRLRPSKVLAAGMKPFRQLEGLT